MTDFLPGPVFGLGTEARDLEGRFVFRGVQQAADLTGITQLDLDHPPSAVGVRVHQFTLGSEGLIDFHHFPADGRIDIAHGLDALDRTKSLLGTEGSADVGEVHIDHITQFALGVIGDADRGHIAFDADPFMALGVLQIIGNFGHVTPILPTTRVECGL